MTCIGAVKLAATATCTSAATAPCAISASRSAVSDLTKRAGTAIFLVDCDGSRVDLLPDPLCRVHPPARWPVGEARMAKKYGWRNHRDNPLSSPAKRQKSLKDPMLTTLVIIFKIGKHT